MEISWIKITTNIFDDEKIMLIESLPEGDTILVIWFKLLTLAGKSNNNGIFMISDKIPYTDEMLSTIFRRSLNTVRLALSTFQQFGMIEIIDGVVTLPNWDKHQNIEGLDRVREQTRNRVAKCRAKQKAFIEETTQNDENVTLRNVTVTEQNKNKKENKNKNNIYGENENTTRFQKPTVDEIKAYCQERNNNVDAERFYDFYESKNWFVGKNKMKDWKASVRTWERKSFSTSYKKRSSTDCYANDIQKNISYENDGGEILPDGTIGF